MYVAGDHILSIAMLRKNPNGVKEWGVGCEELHQHPVVGHKPLPYDVEAMETDIVPNYHVLWQVISDLTPLWFRDEIPVESV